MVTPILVCRRAHYGAEREGTGSRLASKCSLALESTLANVRLLASASTSLPCKAEAGSLAPGEDEADMRNPASASPLSGVQLAGPCSLSPKSFLI